jgi:hypothetical protein
VFGKRSAIAETGAPAPQPAERQEAVADAPPLQPTAPAPARESVPVEAGRAPFPSDGLGAPLIGAPTVSRNAPPANPVPPSIDTRRSDVYY